MSKSILDPNNKQYIQKTPNNKKVASIICDKNVTNSSKTIVSSISSDPLARTSDHLSQVTSSYPLVHTLDNSSQDTSNYRSDYPEAYQKGYILFNDLKIFVNQNVLIPRIETQELSEYIIKYINSTIKNKHLKIAEVGTGSGCISIDLAKRIKNVDITAIDISTKALEVAKFNAKYHNVKGKIKFIDNDLLSKIKGYFNVIVANLPYIPSSYIKNLDSSVKNYEPILALDGGTDGFDLYKKMFSQILENKINFDYMIIEIDDSHVEIAKHTLVKMFTKNKVEILKDKYKYDRFLAIY